MFKRKTFDFLKQLAGNNNRDWFNANKERYESDVRAPALEYIEAMALPMSRLSPHIVVSARKSGGSMMRVYRDTRFGKDKTPYKTNIGIQFRHARGKDVHAPGFYLHIEPGACFIAAGIWKPESSTLNAVRRQIDENPKEWKSLTDKVCKKGLFQLQGDSLKRPPKGYPAEHPLIADLKRKDFIGIRKLPVSAVGKSTFVKDSAQLFKTVVPLVSFICEADDLEF